MLENRDLARVDSTIDLVHEREIDSRYKFDLWRLIRVFIATDNPETVNAILVHGLPKR